MSNTASESNTQKSVDEVPEGTEANPAGKPAEKTEHKAESDFDKTVQEKVNSIIKDRIGREVAKSTKLQETLDAEVAKATKATEDLDKMSGELFEANQKNLKLELALTEGVNLALVESLKGETLEDLKASLAAVKSAQPSSNFSFTGKEYASNTQTFESDAEALKNIRF